MSSQLQVQEQLITGSVTYVASTPLRLRCPMARKSARPPSIRWLPAECEALKRFGLGLRTPPLVPLAQLQQQRR